MCREMLSKKYHLVVKMSKYRNVSLGCVQPENHRQRFHCLVWIFHYVLTLVWLNEQSFIYKWSYVTPKLSSPEQLVMLIACRANAVSSCSLSHSAESVVNQGKEEVSVSTHQFNQMSH